jgi:NADPH:quinone reductase-like Zn-dependent oxidoreductase
MKAFVRTQYGPPSVLKMEDVDSPVVKDDEVLVCVHAASLNQGDLDYLYGKPFLTRMGIGLRAPRKRGLGFDAAGHVEAVSNNVTRFQLGDAVFADLTQFGHSAFAEYAIAPERAWADKPSSLSYEEAATLPQAAILALQGLRGRGGIARGNKVLVNGASGSVGPFAVQVAMALGAHVTGVCSTEKMDMVRGLGADEVIDYTLEDYTRGGPRYDRIVDVAGNRSMLLCLSSRCGDSW